MDLMAATSPSHQGQLPKVATPTSDAYYLTSHSSLVFILPSDPPADSRASRPQSILMAPYNSLSRTLSQNDGPLSPPLQDCVPGIVNILLLPATLYAGDSRHPLRESPTADTRTESADRGAARRHEPPHGHRLNRYWQHWRPIDRGARGHAHTHTHTPSCAKLGTWPTILASLEHDKGALRQC